MNYSNPLDAVPDVPLETRLITTENQCDRLNGPDAIDIYVDSEPKPR